MGFFLLGRGHDAGALRLFSDVVYETRQEALAALADLTSDPGFEHTDDEVFVVDLDAATPVLLVPAPATQATQPPTPEPIVASDVIETPATPAEPEEPTEPKAETPPPEPVEPAIAAAVLAEASADEARPAPPRNPSPPSRCRFLKR